MFSNLPTECVCGSMYSGVVVVLLGEGIKSRVKRLSFSVTYRGSRRRSRASGDVVGCTCDVQEDRRSKDSLEMPKG